MVVEHIDIGRVTSLETEDDPVIPGHVNGPES